MKALPTMKGVTMISSAVSHTVNHETQLRYAAGVQFRGRDQTWPRSGTWPAMALVLENHGSQPKGRDQCTTLCCSK
jgi:hypothetical protein